MLIRRTRVAVALAAIIAAIVLSNTNPLLFCIVVIAVLMAMGIAAIGIAAAMMLLEHREANTR
ncbi:hypothetical protein [Agromyces bauzanensis]